MADPTDASGVWATHAEYVAAHMGVDPDGANEKPLTMRQWRFATAWNGNHTDAARDAGYKGSRSTLSSLGARLFQDARVQRLIAARRSAGLIAESGGDASSGSGPDLKLVRGPELSGTPREMYVAIASDVTLPIGERRRAIERLEQMDRRAAPQEDLDAFQRRQRVTVMGLIKARLRRLRGE